MEKTSENNKGEWYPNLTTEVEAGQHTLEELLGMLEEKPIVFILILKAISLRNLEYTQEIHNKVIEAMERYEQRTDIKKVIYLHTEKLLKNGKA
jgi:hypothetical protein